VENSGARIAGLLMGRQCKAKFIRSLAPAGKSKCALAVPARGDYEDPDRTAWTPDDAEDEERNGARRAPTEELPAED